MVVHSKITYVKHNLKNWLEKPRETNKQTAISQLTAQLLFLDANILPERSFLLEFQIFTRFGLAVNVVNLLWVTIQVGGCWNLTDSSKKIMDANEGRIFGPPVAVLPGVKLVPCVSVTQDFLTITRTFQNPVFRIRGIR